MLRGMLGLEGMLGKNFENALTSKTILELRHVLECGAINQGLIGKPRSQRILTDIGHSRIILEVVQVIGVLKIEMEVQREIGQLVVSQERGEKDVRKWRNVLKFWKTQ
jgi:hypothetical protein